LNHNWLIKTAATGFLFEANGVAQGQPFYQTDALAHVGSPYTISSTNATANNTPYALVLREAINGSNCADFSLIGRKIDVVIDCVHDVGTAILLFGGRSQNNSRDGICDFVWGLHNSNANDREVQLCLIREGTAVAEAAVTSATPFTAASRRVYLVRFERFAPTLSPADPQRITVWNNTSVADPWDTVGSAIITHQGNWTSSGNDGKCGPFAGVVGGAWLNTDGSPNPETLKAVLNKVLIRHYQ
jgi:hypothetical protein